MRALLVFESSDVWLGLLVVATMLHASTVPARASSPPPAAVAQVIDIGHVPPIDAPISDPFRAPEHEFGPGNRGIEYRTNVGDQVRASAAGTVSFAGSVAGSLFVSVDHGGGLITTVGFLDEVAVRRGEAIEQGQALGAAGERTHFSARQDGIYFDPEQLFGPSQLEFHVTVRLVGGPD